MHRSHCNHRYALSQGRAVFHMPDQCSMQSSIAWHRGCLQYVYAVMREENAGALLGAPAKLPRVKSRRWGESDHSLLVSPATTTTQPVSLPGCPLFTPGILANTRRLSTAPAASFLVAAHASWRQSSFGALPLISRGWGRTLHQPLHLFLPLLPLRWGSQEQGQEQQLYFNAKPLSPIEIKTSLILGAGRRIYPGPATSSCSWKLLEF